MSDDLRELFGEPISVLGPAKPICLEIGHSLAEAIDLLQKHSIGCLLVTAAGRLRGIFTERDVMRHIAGKDIDLTAPIDAYMTKDPEILRAEDPIAYALNRMSLGGYRHVPLVDDNDAPQGIISVKDVVNHIVEHFADEVFNLPPEPGVHSQSREGA